MKFKVKYSPNALCDLDEIWEYISNILKDSIAADRTVNGILDKTELLSEQSMMGTPLYFENNLYSGYRYVICKNYMAFYRLSDDVVYVDRIIYGKRDYMRLLFG